MKRIIFLFALIAFVVACNSNGERYKVNEKSEVYYKDGMTSEDAKKLGDFLLKNGYFDSTNEKSVQLLKEKDTISVKFVVDKARLMQDESADYLFTIIGSAISSEVFPGKPLRVVLADAYMKPFKSLPVPGTSATVPATK